MIYYLLISNAIALLVLGSGVYALRKLGWQNRWHHLWFALGAFVFGPATILDIVVRTIALVVGAFDGSQHLIQWFQWKRLRASWIAAHYDVPSRNPYEGQPPDESIGFPGMYRDPLHRAYWWVVTHV